MPYALGPSHWVAPISPHSQWHALSGARASATASGRLASLSVAGAALSVAGAALSTSGRLAVSIAALSIALPLPRSADEPHAASEIARSQPLATRMFSFPYASKPITTPP